MKTITLIQIALSLITLGTRADTLTGSDSIPSYTCAIEFCEIAPATESELYLDGGYVCLTWIPSGEVVSVGTGSYTGPGWHSFTVPDMENWNIYTEGFSPGYSFSYTLGWGFVWGGVLDWQAYAVPLPGYNVADLQEWISHFEAAGGAYEAEQSSNLSITGKKLGHRNKK